MLMADTLSIAESGTSGTGTIDTSYDDVATGDKIKIWIDTDEAGTDAKGLIVTMEFQLP